MERSRAITRILSSRRSRRTARLAARAAPTSASARTAGSARTDSRADQRTQQGASARPLQELGEILVDGRVLEETAQRSLTRIETLGHCPEIGHRDGEIGGHLPEPGVWSTSHEL